MIAFPSGRSAVEMIGPLKRELAVVKTIGKHEVICNLRRQSF